MRAILLGPTLGSTEEQGRVLKQVRIQTEDLLIGVDGGTDQWMKFGIHSDFAIGDWDSLKRKEVLKSVPHITLPSNKNRSDLFFASVAAIVAGAEKIVALGVTGERPDHHMAALSDLSILATGKYGKVTEVQALGSEGEYHFLSTNIPKWTKTVRKGTLVSVFPMCSTVKGVTLRGFKYSLENETLQPSSFGLSNCAKIPKIEICLQKGQLLVILPRVF